MKNPKVYKSGVSNGLVAFLTLVFLVVVVAGVLSGDMRGLIAVLPAAAFIMHLFATTYYIIDGTTLKVKSGFFLNIAIDITTIRKIEETNTILSAPAASLDRLEVTYNRYDSVIISPKNKAEFIADILAINNQIEVICKSKPTVTAN